MLQSYRFDASTPHPAIVLAGQNLTPGETTWTAEPHVGETAFSGPAVRWGTDYMHARYYKPIWGRFLSVDPLRGSPADPQSWNRYSYVRGNPLGRVDPDGRKDRRTQEEKAILEDPDVLAAMGEVIQKSNYDQKLQNRNEAGTTIVEPTPGDFSATPVITGKLTSVPFEPVVAGKVVSTGEKAVGAVHSHPGSGTVTINKQRLTTDASISSAGDKRNAGVRGVPSYIIDSNRSMIRYDPATGKDTRVLTGRDYRAYRDRAVTAIVPRSTGLCEVP